MRLDLNDETQRGWGLSYKSHPHGTQVTGLAWVVDHSYGGRLARLQGWDDYGSAEPPADTWGWGVPVRVKDYRAEMLKTLVIPRGTSRVVTGTQYADGTLLFREDRDEKATGLQNFYIDRAVGLDPALFKPRETSGKANGVPLAPSEDSVVQILRLEKEVEKLRMAEEANTRVRRNYEDTGPMGWEKDPGIGNGEQLKRDQTPLEKKVQATVVEKVVARPETLEEHGGKEAQWSEALFTEMRKRMMSELKEDWGLSLACGCDAPGWGLEYDGFLLQLKKNTVPHGRCKGCILGPGVMEDHIHLIYRAAYPRVGEAIIERAQRLRKEIPDACRHGVQALLKKETGLYKMGGGGQMCHHTGGNSVIGNWDTDSFPTNL
ncbi:hypothetical protein WN48_02713 [Eufriesea mexicana]|uniref:Uncharacterized protein n=1 Tax=Eufriesea mexicana TaxID=516756 RepID=A0A310SD48_9HYME|nr:hypothetical protein WN48_02713 [Eufriesea mexicana]